MTSQTAKAWLQHYPEGVRPSLDYPLRPLHSLMDDAADRFPGAPAAVFFGNRLTWSEVRRQADSFAAALATMGVKKGDRVAIMLPNVPQALIAYFGVLKAGAVVVFCNPLYVERELEHQLKDSGAM